MRNVVVTGGGTGIGYAVARAFVACGDRVWITGRRAEVLAEAVRGLGGGARAVGFDAADPAAVSRAIEDLPDPVHVLVNNAGGNTDLAAAPAGEPGAAADLASIAAAWRANLDANLLSAVLVTAALTPRLPEGGRVVTVGSIAARKGAGSYGAAKAAVEAWTADLSATLGRRGVTANVVAPGLTLGTGFFRGRLTDRRAQVLVDATHTGHAGTPEDIAAVVVFLASGAARHVTGQVIHANGGAYLGR
jgi:3-oxoacyl-[acyl-carrier protein] reductase